MDLETETSFAVYSKAVGYVLVDERKYPFGETVVCGPGRVKISVHAGRIDAFPSVYIKGEVICSDKSWQAEDYANAPAAAGYSTYFTEEGQDPAVWEYSEKVYLPVKTESCKDGVLYEFETELTAALEITDRAGGRPVRVYCGESKEEALDAVHCYYSWELDPGTGRCPRCAVRFAYIPGRREEEIGVRAIHQFVDIPVRAAWTRCGRGSGSTGAVC
ncbi:MAG: hypothetical protein HFI88_13425 [Lachnospiraceae bacterium]|nr:hypothetical protein [Lachnospiraceae bacterium]